ncbi:MAG: hypothetical protein GVY36_12475 [Verrucomicrobia bacterium]|jgi:hypothetical protein|nr:hypothetical protein [Verrucomicrobiota bacterium]
MKKEKIISLLFIVVIIGGIGYGIYRNTGKVIHEVLVLEGETVRVGNLTTRKVSQQFRTHEFTIPGGQEYSVFLEGRFPDPTKRIHPENNYALKITSSAGAVLFDDTVRIGFKRREKKEGLSQIIADFFPGKTSSKVTDLMNLTSDTVLRIEFSRLDGDTVANELFLTVREKRV